VAFTVELAPRAERDLARLPAKVQTSVVGALTRLALDPYGQAMGNDWRQQRAFIA
jgi:hypothetical protein